MQATLVQPHRHNSAIRIGYLIAVFALLIALTPRLTLSFNAAAETRLHPALVNLAAEQPDLPIRVIVQRTTANADLEPIITQLGGQIVRDLHIINALVVELPAAKTLELAKANGVAWISPDAPVWSSSSQPHTFVTWANATTLSTAANSVDSLLGPNGTFAVIGKNRASYSGFTAEQTPDHIIIKVEALIHVYVSSELEDDDEPKLSIAVGDNVTRSVRISYRQLNQFKGVSKAGTLAIDITAQRLWQWSDFDNNLRIIIDQRTSDSPNAIQYDAIGLRITSAPGISLTGDTGGDNTPLSTINAAQQGNVYNDAIRATQLWNSSARLQGRGVSVAVVDSGVFKTKDLGKRVRVNVNFNPGFQNGSDRYGHGTFIAGLIAGNGNQSNGKYIGVAPRADIINVRISDENGMSTEGDVVAALQWINNNRTRYNIRVVNLSLNASMPQSYHTSALAAACEILWFNGIVVVVSAGNNGTATLYPPANDPFVITVGAVDDRGTASIQDDVVASFSAYGVTEAGTTKPELVAPGRNIVGLLPENDLLTISRDRPKNRIDRNYFRMSGTSMSAPIVSGAIALLLQDEPNLTPDQVKFRLMATANRDWPGYSPETAGAGYLDAFAAVNGTTTESANTGLPASQILVASGATQTWGSVNWGSVNWGSVNWGSVNWGSVNWGSVNWGSVNWGSDYWEE